MFKSTISAVAMTISAAALFATSASAADLGGNCCGDLEERIAELEATTVRKGNRKVSLTVSGQVNTGILFYDDGVESNVHQVDNNNSSTRFRFLGNAKIDANWSAGYLLEIEAFSAASNAVTQGNDDGNPNAINLRHSAWYIEHKQLGRLWVGQTSPATDDIILADTSGVGVFAFADQLWGSSLQFRRSGSGSLTGFTTSSLVPNLDTSRRNVVRYDTPTLAGFRATATYGEDDFWDVGLWYAGKIGDFSIAGGIGYLQDTEGNGFNGVTPAANATLGPDFNEFKGSISVSHNPTGLFGDFAFLHREFDSIDRITNRNRADFDYYYARGGWSAKLFPIGNTIFYGEYAHGEGGAENTNVPAGAGLTGIVTKSDFEFYGFGITQLVPSAATELYIGYKRLEADIATSNQGKIATEDIDIVGGGARIKF